MVTQQDIAKTVGLDVSSVNKILNRVPGPVFRKETVKAVFQIAKELGYNFKRETKPSLKRRIEALERILKDVVPQFSRDDVVAKALGLTPARVSEIKEILYYGKKGA